MSAPAQDWAAAVRAGDFETAWRFSERALAERDRATRDDPSLPYHLRWVWDGRPFDGRHVLVRCYHGLGDTIQFARFLPALARRAASVTVEVQPRLVSLVREIAEITFVPFDPAHPLPESECDIEIMELDFALRARPDSVSIPYIRRAPAPLPGRTIGLCLQAGDWDLGRCIGSALVQSLCETAHFLTLDAAPTNLPVLNPDGCPFDLELTAALVSGVDLVITVDTMIAHLAGAMGRPTWLLLKADPDWRWCPDRRTSLWYPTLRQYVQDEPGDWGGVLREVERDLAHFTAMEGQAACKA